MKDKLLKALAVIGSAIFWRLGGAEGYSKLYRRIGSTIACSLIVWNVWAVIPIAYGCISYSGWINKFLSFIKDKDREFWWNFAFSNIVLQCGVLFVANDVKNIIFAIASGALVAFIKVWIDEKYPLTWRPRRDVVSEIAHGGLNALCLWINILI